MGKPKKIAILGSTGSIGTQTLEVIRHFPDEFIVTALAGGQNWGILGKQVQEFQPFDVFLRDETGKKFLERSFNYWKPDSLVTGKDNLKEFAQQIDCDLLVVATVGWAGVEPTLAAIDRGIDIALANKEVLVCAGDLVMERARQAERQDYKGKGVKIWPIDSEHNALMQCLFACSQDGAEPDNDRIQRLILTASGGPFRNASSEEIASANSKQTLAHPTWSMGPKITVDSATLMNKGFEVIEAHHLFGIEPDRIEVVVHPQSIIHSMIEFIDGSIIAQLGKTDMLLPIQNILLQPERRKTWLEPLDFTTLGSLDFGAPDYEKFPCLRMAFDAMKTGGSMPCALNAANEVAVAAHLQDRITCGQIPTIVSRVLDQHELIAKPTLDHLMMTDRRTRQITSELI